MRKPKPSAYELPEEPKMNVFDVMERLDVEPVAIAASGAKLYSATVLKAASALLLIIAEEKRNPPAKPKSQ